MWILFIVTITTNAVSTTSLEFATKSACETARIQIESAQSGFRYSSYGTCVAR